MEKKNKKRLFALLGFCADLLDLSLSGSTGYFFLDSSEGACIDNGRMAVLYIELRSGNTIIDLDLFGNAVRDVGFIKDCITFISLIL